MKTERMIERLYAIAKLMESDDCYMFEQNVKKNTHIDIDYSLPIQLANLVLDLQNDLRAEEAKKSGKNKALTAAKRILKNSVKYSPKEVTHYAQEYDDGTQCVMDNFHAVKFAAKNKLPLEPMPESVRKSNDLFPIDQSIPRKNNYKVELPSVSDLKSHIKISKAENKAVKYSSGRTGVMYDFGEGLPLVKAEYLLDIMECLPEARAYLNGNCKDKGAIYFTDGENEGVLMPVYK